MLALAVLVAAMVLPIIFCLLAPNRRRLEHQLATSTPPATAAALSSIKVSASPKQASSLSREAVELKGRLLITKENVTVTVSISPNFMTSKEYEGLGKVLDSLVNISQVYLLIKCTTDDEESTVRQKLSTVSPHWQTQSHRILVCSSHVGKIAFLRQLRPILHLEYEPLVYDEIRPHVPLLVLHRLSDAPELYAAHRRPYPNLLQRGIQELLTLQVQE